jgi:hypothetical protein
MVTGTLKSSRGAALGAVLSPFKGGLNNVGEGATIDDTQVALLQNFDVDTDGTLVNRPAIENTGSLPPVGNSFVSNLVTDPRGSNVANFTAGGGTLAKFTGQVAPPDAPTATTAMRTTVTTAVTSVDVRIAGIAVVPGTTYSFGVAMIATGPDSLYHITARWLDAGGATISQSVSADVASAGTTNVRVKYEGVVAPVGAVTAMLIAARNGATFATGNYVQATAFIVTATTTLGAYFDGEFTSTSTKFYDWAGTTDASVSRFYDIAADPAPVTALGYYIRSDSMTFLIGVCGGRTWIFDLTNKVWTRIWDSAASDFCQYDNKIVLISETTSGGYWEAGVFTATTSMPKGSGIVVYNERFWCFGPKGTTTSTTIFFSNITSVSPSTSIYSWTTSTDFFVVDKGDGQWITAIVADPNALLIFRSASTYQFTYPNAPINGTLSLLNSSVGVDHRWAIVRYENYYWVLNQGYLYQFISYQFYPRNAQVVRFDAAPIPVRYIDTALGVLGDRIVIYYYGSVYVYNVRQQVWSTWVSALAPGRVLQMPASSSGNGPRKAMVFCGSDAGAAARNLLQITDSPSGSQYAGEAMVCTVRTKTYNFSSPGIFKRMTYWAIGFRSASGVTGTAVPVGVNEQDVTVDQMEAYTFDQLDLGGWDAPIIATPKFIDNIEFPASAPVQALAKAKGAFRFLSIYYEATLATMGTPATAPARIFSLTSYLKQHSRTKEKVS